jgi:hypothetical protein
MAWSRQPVWYKTLREIMEELGYESSCIDPCLFTRGEGDQRIAIVVHVDDGICTGIKEQVKAALDEIATKIGIKDMGEAKEFLSLELRQDEGRLWIGQSGY